MVRQYRDEQRQKVGSEMSSHELTLWVSPDPSDYEVMRIPSILDEEQGIVKVDRGDGVSIMFTSSEEVFAMVDVMERVVRLWLDPR